MKKHFLRLSMVVALLLASGYSVNAQVVRERPRGHTEVEVRPARPSARHYWREGEWEWRGGAYVWAPGIWIVPEHGNVWVRGHWRRRPGGEVWVPGHWR